MTDCLTIKKIKKMQNRIEYFYEAEGKWKEFLKENMFIEYDDNIEEIPDSVAIVPFLCNILPISWVFDLTISVNILDKDFYECIQNVKRGYIEMYPIIKMKGNIVVKKIEENYYKPNGAATLFSGGVDAFNTLFSHIDEKPMLVTLWGADVALEDTIGWNRVKKHHIMIADEYKLKYSFIKTNFRTFINYSKLCEYISKIGNFEWWHDFQHGIGILGHLAPIAYINKLKFVYIASSNTAESRKTLVCASDPTIDNYLKYTNCQVIHDGYEYNRQDKIHNICQYLEKIDKESIQIRVCWKSTGGKNCCECEKCYRTIMGIIVEGKDPRNFGFDFTDEKRRKMMKVMPKLKEVKYDFANYYSIMQNKFLENYTLEETPKDLMWFRNIKMKNGKPKYVIIMEKLLVSLKNKIRKILRK